MPSVQTIIIEAVVVGLLLIPITYVAGYFAKMITSKPSLPEICSTWNENGIMEVNIFIAGFLFHILAQVTGLNEWYVRNYQF